MTLEIVPSEGSCGVLGHASVPGPGESLTSGRESLTFVLCLEANGSGEVLAGCGGRWWREEEARLCRCHWRPPAIPLLPTEVVEFEGEGGSPFFGAMRGLFFNSVFRTVWSFSTLKFK